MDLMSGLLALLGVITGLFLLERDKRQKAETKVENSGLKEKDAVSKYKVEELDKEREALKSDLDKLEKNTSEEKSPEEIENYWNNKKE